MCFNFNYVRRLPGVKATAKILLFWLFLPVLSNAAIYEVGPNRTFKKISDVSLDSLKPGDVVKIYYREEPYNEKIILRNSGTKSQPIVITGISENGKKPIIDGSNAMQSQHENWSQSDRWLIKIGDKTSGDYVHVKNLEIRRANNLHHFISRQGASSYGDNAAGIFIRLANNVLISGCHIHGCGNGIQTTYGPYVDQTTISKCIIQDNGNHTNLGSSQEHNVYLCGTNTTVQFCRFGDVHSDGNNIKDRGKGTVIRYNWIEGGKNRQIDLVEYEEYGQSDAYVYGNVIVQGDQTHNTNMIHWGGEESSRSGVLYLFNNTIVSKHNKTRYLVTRFPDCRIDMINNAFIGPGKLWNGRGEISGKCNWFSDSISLPSQQFLGQQGGNVTISTSGKTKYMPLPDSPLINAGTNVVSKSVSYMPGQQSGGYKRPRNGPYDIGAFESIWK